MEHNSNYNTLLGIINHHKDQLNTTTHKQQDFDLMRRKIEEHMERCVHAIEFRKMFLLNQLDLLAQQHDEREQTVRLELQNFIHNCQKILEAGSDIFSTNANAADLIWQSSLVLESPKSSNERAIVNVHINMPQDLLLLIENYGSVGLRQPSSRARSLSDPLRFCNQTFASPPKTALFLPEPKKEKEGIANGEGSQEVLIQNNDLAKQSLNDIVPRTYSYPKSTPERTKVVQANPNITSPSHHAFSPLLGHGFFDINFRYAFKEFLFSAGMGKICPWIDLIIDVTKFKCVFENSLVVPTKSAISNEIYCTVNAKSKTKTKKMLHDVDPRFAEAKKRAQRTTAKYCATDSPNYISFGKPREKLFPVITNQISQSYFNKAEQLAWHTLEAALPQFLCSILHHRYCDQKSLADEILRCERRLVDVETEINNAQSSLQILRQQYLTLTRLFLAKKLKAKRNLPLATYFCGFSQFNTMNKIWEQILPIPFEISGTNELLCHLKCQNEIPASFRNISYGITTSWYPEVDTNNKLGDPICDTFRLYLTKEYSVVVTADGCNWGRMPYEAAHNASNAIVEYICEHISSIRDTQFLGQLLVQGLEAAHQAILAPAKYKLNVSAASEVENWDVGATTIVVAIVQTQNRSREMICASLGVCKLMAYRAGKVIDITEGNLKALTEKSTSHPGGALGPILPMGRPDLDNLTLFSFSCEKDDLVFAVTDGIYENFHPQQLGMLPRAIGLDADTWQSIEKLDNTTVMKVISKYLTSKMEEVISKYAAASCSPVDPTSLTTALMEHSLNITQAGRTWMEKHPGMKLPQDYTMFPGKMDHATCICTKII